jgi:hypothetical protein
MLNKGDTVTLRGTVTLVYTQDTGTGRAIQLAQVNYPILVEWDIINDTFRWPDLLVGLAVPAADPDEPV